ncbi:MAG: group III truncated hemoglobin [Bacteroidota bacterium]
MKKKLNIPYHQELQGPLEPEGPEDLRTEIESDEDIRIMVHAFYAKVDEDDRLGPMFNEVAEVEWDTHLSKMVNFWSNLLFQTGRYQGRPFRAHQPLPIQITDFDRWLSLFWETVDEHFVGQKAYEAKEMAAKIANAFAIRLSMNDQEE